MVIEIVMIATLVMLTLVVGWSAYKRAEHQRALNTWLVGKFNGVFDDITALSSRIDSLYHRVDDVLQELASQFVDNLKQIDTLTEQLAAEISNGTATKEMLERMTRQVDAVQAVAVYVIYTSKTVLGIHYATLVFRSIDEFLQRAPTVQGNLTVLSILPIFESETAEALRNHGVLYSELPPEVMAILYPDMPMAEPPKPQLEVAQLPETSEVATSEEIEEGIITDSGVELLEFSEAADYEDEPPVSGFEPQAETGGIGSPTAASGLAARIAELKKKDK